MKLPVSKFGRKSRGRWLEGPVFVGILATLISLAFAGSQRLLRPNARVLTSEPVHATVSPSDKADFFFTHTAPPAIQEDEPNLKISLPVHNSTSAEVYFENVSRSCSCADAELKSRTLAAAPSVGGDGLTVTGDASELVSWASRSPSRACTI